MAGYGSGLRKRGKYLFQAIYTHHEWHLQALAHYYYLCVVATMDYSILKPHTIYRSSPLPRSRPRCWRLASLALLR